MPSPERLTTRGLQVVPIETPSLGDRSYLAHDGAVAVVVDPQRDIDRVLALAEDEGVRITHVLETHIHNDYVTGGLALARATGASYHVNADDDVAFERTPIRGGDVVEVSASMRVRAIATPGHTFTHLSYALEECADDRRRRSPSSPAGRCCSARPAAPTCSATSTPRSSPACSTRRRAAWRRTCPGTPRSCRPTGSARSAPPARPTAARTRRRSRTSGSRTPR